MCADIESQPMFELAAGLRRALPAVVAAATAWLPRPRRMPARWLVAVLLGWSVDMAFTDEVFDPVARAESFGDEEAHMRYAPSILALSLSYGWLLPMLAATAALGAAWILRRARRTWLRRRRPR